MRGNLAGISLCRTHVCQQKVPGQTRTWAQGLAMMKVSMALNGTLPDEKSATPEHVVGTSFVLCSALLGPDGLGDQPTAAGVRPVDRRGSLVARLLKL